MRREIETVPKDGKLVILEDDGRGTYELARWSTEQSAWVSENGKPIPIMPTHWLPLQRDGRLLPSGDKCLQKKDQSSAASDCPIQHTVPVSSDRTALECSSAREDVFALGQHASAINLPDIELPTAAGVSGLSSWYRFVAPSIAAAMIASSLVGMYFRVPIIASATQYADQYGVAGIGRLVEHLTKQAAPLPVRELQEAALFQRAPAVQPPGRFDKSGEQRAVWDAKQTTMVSQATEILDTERRRLYGLESKLAELPPSMEGRERRLRDVAATTPQSQEPDGEKHALSAAREDLAMNGVHYRKTLAAERDRSAALASELTTIQRNVETQVAQSNKTANELAQLKTAADSAASELQRERERAEALALELATARREVESATAASSRKEDEAVQFRRKAEATAAELKQSLQQERQRAETLSSDLGKVRRELDALSILSSQKDDEAAQLKRASETATAALQQSLQQQREEAQALERELAKVQQSADAQVAKSRKTNEEAATTKQIEIDFVGASRRESTSNQAADYAKVQLKPTLHLEQGKTVGNALSVEPLRQAAGTVQSLPMGEPNGSETAGLLARAKALLGQGNIGAARVVLERAAETGSAQATFALAETYDPNVLATWRTLGTRGDVIKARDLYARAYDGGIKAASDRSDALVAGDGGRKPASWFGREGDNR